MTPAEKIMEALTDQGKPTDMKALKKLEWQPDQDKRKAGVTRKVLMNVQADDVAALCQPLMDDAQAAALWKGCGSNPGKKVTCQVSDILHVLALAKAIPGE